MERIRIKAGELVDTLNNTLSRVPDFLVPQFVVDTIQAGIRRMYELYNDLARRIQEFFRSPGWPWALYGAGDRWLNDVARPAADLEEEINSDRLDVDDYWKGSAAAAYTKSLGRQQSAFAAMVGVARKIKECLDTAARAMIAFWIALVLAIGTAVAGIATAIGLALSGVGAPGAPAAAIAGLVGGIAAIAGGVVATTDQFRNVVEQADALREESDLNTAFDGDRWPSATADGGWRAD